ncbi:hypothetical protein [uncultured Mediterranean phage uvMED]|nr:hypothetical protein [uncultured Mediterranean phage uvMED]
MDSLRLFEGMIALNTTMTKIKLSLDEIKEKSSHRFDLIDSMSTTLADLEIAKSVMKDLEENWRLECKTSFRMTQLNVELQNKVSDLQEEVIDLNREI